MGFELGVFMFHDRFVLRGVMLWIDRFSSISALLLRLNDNFC